jgi:hypothetical protein
MFLTVQDFTGKYQLSTGMYDVTKLQDYIDKYEKRYLIELFGAKLYDEFISDLNIQNVPKSPNFLKIYNPFYENITFRQLIISEGILEMLKGFVYFEYSKDLINQMTPYGNVRPISENSESVSTLYSMIYARYNEAIKTYRAIQTYIVTNFNAPTGQVISISLLTGGTNYVSQINNGTQTLIYGDGNLTLNIVANNFFVVTGGTVNIAGINYAAGIITTVVGGNYDATFEITYVGKGDFTTFNGQAKQTVYWV